MKYKSEEHSQSMLTFFILWTGQMLSMIGTQAAQFALVWWLTTLTGSATVLATATLMAVLPRVIIGPLAGTYVDRWNRRNILFVADSLVALGALLLAFLFWQDAVQVWHVYLLMFIRAVGETFHWPAMQASTSLMVPEKHLARVAGINQALIGVFAIVAPPLGALLLELIPMHGIMGVDVATALFAVMPLLFITIPQPKRKSIGSDGQKSSVWTELLEGLRYVRLWRGLMILMGMAAILNFILTPASSLIPLLVKEHFQKGALQLSWLEATFGSGVIVGGLLLGVWGGFKRRIFTSMMGLFGLGLGILLLGLAPSNAFWIAIVGMGVMGIMNPITNGPIFAILQATVEPEIQGRVFTLIGSLAGIMSPLSLLLAGPVADTIGLQLWYIVGGITCLIMAISGFLISDVANIELNQHQPVQAPINS